jgi:tetratricopeptide (TPR) repeat protein
MNADENLTRELHRGCGIQGLIQSMRRVLLLSVLASAVLAVSGCARLPVAAAPSSPPAGPTTSDRLAAADGLVRQGCLDCLLDAYREYDTLRNGGSDGERATLAAIRTGALIALRERELGLVDSGYLAKARELAGSMPAPPSSLIELLDIADALPYGSPAARPPAVQERRLLLQVSRDWLTAPEPPAGLAAHQELFGYVWLALACDVGSGSIRADNARAGLGAMRDFPLLIFKFTTACDRRNPASLGDLLAREPRFTEVNYYLGIAALSGQSQPSRPGRPDLDEANSRMQAAYEWRPDWPALTVMLGNIAMTAEDFEGALTFYQQTLALVPDQPDAMIGSVRSLTALERHREAMAVADGLIAAGRYPGDARYWRALNEVHLSRFEEAWADIELATALLVNADVPKLAGIVAINRQEYDVARRRLEEASGRRPADCEVGFYLQIAQSELRAWADAAATATGAGACFDREEAQLRGEIDELRTSDTIEARRNRLIASRELRIATNERMRAACWFNAAAALFNVGERDRARVYAEKVVEDDRFGERARDLMSRLGSER